MDYQATMSKDELMEELERLEKDKKPTDADAAFRAHIMNKWKKVNAAHTLKAKQVNEQLLKAKRQMSSMS